LNNGTSKYTADNETIVSSSTGTKFTYEAKDNRVFVTMLAYEDEPHTEVEIVLYKNFSDG